jgi:hypothetical protein
MLLGSDNAEIHNTRVLMKVYLILHIAWYVIRHICKRHGLINRDINIRISIQSNHERFLCDVGEQSSETK